MQNTVSFNTKRHILFNPRPFAVALLGALCGVTAVLSRAPLAVALCAVAVYAVYTAICKAGWRWFTAFAACLAVFALYGTLALDVKPVSEEKQQYYATVAQTDTESIIVQNVTFAGGSVHGRCLLYCNAKGLTAGDSITFTATLSAAKPKANESSFDSRYYLLSRNVKYSASTNDITVTGNSLSILRPFEKARNAIKSTVFAVLDDDGAALICGMVLGDDGVLAQDIADGFSSLGIAHVLCVSGLHVMVIAGAIAYVLSLLGASTKTKTAITLLFLLAYCGITAFTPSVVRASVMAACLLLGRASLQKYDGINSLCFAALIIMLFNPFACLAVGMQLSFAATAGIIAYAGLIKVKNVRLNSILGAFNVTLAAQITCLPVLVNTFGGVSVISPAANLLLVPFASFAITVALPLCVLCTLIPALMPCLGALKVFTVPLIAVARWCAGFGFVRITHIGGIAVAAFYVIIVLISKYILLKPKTKVIAVCTVLVLAITGCICMLDRATTLTVLAVGDENCAVVRTSSGKTVLIDGGSSDYFSVYASNRGVKELQAFLSYKGITSIDAAIITHDDTDHAGALAALRGVEVKQLYYCPYTFDSSAMLERLRQVCGQSTAVAAGDSITVGELTFDFIAPKADTGETNLSLVFTMRCGNTVTLFTGDAQSGEVSELLQTNKLKCDIIMLPHHGSVTTFDERLTDAAGADTGIISSKRETAPIVQYSCGRVYNTSHCGQITVEYKEGAYTVKTYLH